MSNTLRQQIATNKAFNPSGGSGGFGNRRFLAAVRVAAISVDVELHAYCESREPTENRAYLP